MRERRIIALALGSGLLLAFAPPSIPQEAASIADLTRLAIRAGDAAAAELERRLDLARERTLHGTPAPGDGELEEFAGAALHVAFIDPARIASARIEDGRAATARRAENRAEYQLAYETDVASGFAEVGQIDAAAAQIAKALAVFDEAIILRPRALNVCADIERARGHWEKALERVRECEGAFRAGFEAFQDGERCKLHCVAAQLDLDMGLPDRAEQRLRLARAVLEQGDLSQQHPLPLEFAVLRATASLWATTDRQDQLVTLFEKQWADASFASEAPGLRVLGRVMLGAAMCDRAISRPAAATPKGIRIAEGEFKDGAEVLRGALADPAIDAEGRRMALKSLIEWHLARGELDAARRRFAELSIETARGTAQTPQAWRERALLATFALRIARAGDESAASFKETLALRVDELDRAARKWMERLEELPARPGGLGLLHYSENRAILAELLRGRLVDALSETSERDAWRALSSAQLLGSLTRLCGARHCELERFRRDYLTDDHGVLVFLPAHPRSVVLAIDRETMLFDSLAAEDELESARKRLSSILSAPPSAPEAKDERLESARLRLAELLFTPPVRARLERWRRVTILGSELHENLPFECLPWKEGQVLGLTKAVDTLPSVPLGPLLRERFGERAALGVGSVVVVAAPKSGPDAPVLPEIPWSRERTRARTDLYPPGVLRMHAGSDASIEALRSTAISAASVLEIVAHGAFAPERERPAHILLAPAKGSDGRLWCEVVDGIGADPPVRALRSPRVVILASCGAARDQKRYGEDGVSNLGGAFLLAGAQCVVISRYDIELEATELMTAVVHQRLQAGDSCAEAMCRARSALATSGKFAHPFYWSALQVFGDGQVAVFR